MQIEYSTDIHFPARKVSLQQLASLWSAVMTCLPEVRHCSAKFNRRGRVTGKYVYDDADELAHADLDVRPGELELSYIHIFGPDIDVTIREHWDASFWGMLLFKSTALNVCISGSNERDILRLRTPLEQWGERHFETRSRLTQWLNLGVLAAGLGAVGVFTANFDKQALATIMFGLIWTGFWLTGGTLLRPSKLRIVNAARPPGAGRGGRAPAEPARPNPIREDGHRTTGTQREDA